VTDFSHCPDCSTHLGKDRTRCRCGWVKPADAAYLVAGEPRPICRTVGCRQPAMNGHAHCQPCTERIRHEEAEAFCQAQGLVTLADKKRFVREKLKSFARRPSFERWAENMKQESVDFLVRGGGRDDLKVLDRLRAMGIVDDENRLIPLEGRAAAREAREAKVRAERAKAEEILRAQGVVRPTVPEVT
jgi:hypothetical protein